jgi:vinculin
VKGHTFCSGGKGHHEAAENRNYLSQRMTDEMNEIVRVLQLTSYDEDEWDEDNVTVMKKAFVSHLAQ